MRKQNYLLRPMLRIAPFLAVLLLPFPVALAQNNASEDINARFRQADINAAEWAQRFEMEGREVYDFRESIVELIGLQPGQDIADIGAGSGLFEPLFAERTAPQGTVYAVDIAPAFLEYIRARAEKSGLKNIETVLGSEHSVELPEDSVDIIFICDTYHHFAHPADTLASIHHALRPGGQLFLVEFDKKPGVSSEWVRSHIRSTREEFTAEIEAGGFHLIEDLTPADMKETFILRFGKN